MPTAPSLMTILSSRRRRESTARSGRSACAIHSPSPCSRAPVESSSTTWAITRGKRSTRASPGPTTAGPSRKARPGTRGSAARSTPTRSRRSPAAAFCPGGAGRRLPARISGEILLHGLRPRLDQGARPRAPGQGRDLRLGAHPPLRPGLRARRQPLRALARCLGHRRQVPAAHGLTAQDPGYLGSIVRQANAPVRVARGMRASSAVSTPWSEVHDQGRAEG